MTEDRHLHLASLNMNQKKLDETLKKTIKKIDSLVKDSIAKIKFNYCQKHSLELPHGDIINVGLNELDSELLGVRWELQTLLNSTRFNGKPVVDVVRSLEAEATNPEKPPKDNMITTSVNKNVVHIARANKIWWRTY